MFVGLVQPMTHAPPTPAPINFNTPPTIQGMYNDRSRMSASGRFGYQRVNNEIHKVIILK